MKRFFSSLYLFLFCLALFPVPALANTDQYSIFQIESDEKIMFGVKIPQHGSFKLVRNHKNTAEVVKLLNQLKYTQRWYSEPSGGCDANGIVDGQFHSFDFYLIQGNSRVHYTLYPDMIKAPHHISYRVTSRIDKDAIQRIAEIFDEESASGPSFHYTLNTNSWYFIPMLMCYYQEILDFHDKTRNDESYTFRPDDIITRAEATTMLMRAMDVPSNSETKQWFTDTMIHWANMYVNLAAERGIMQGKNDGNFDPDGTLTRAEAAAILCRAKSLTVPSTPTAVPFRDVPVNAWYTGYVSAVSDAGYMVGSDGMFRPSDKVTRAEFAQIIYNLYLK